MSENPSSSEIKKKFKIVEDLFNIAYKVKYHQLRLQHPTWTHQQVHDKTIELIDRGCA